MILEGKYALVLRKCDVRLEGIKFLKDQQGRGIAEAANIIDRLPCVIYINKSKEFLESVAKYGLECGCSSEIIEIDLDL